jgi:hypothetical protein
MALIIGASDHEEGRMTAPKDPQSVMECIELIGQCLENLQHNPRSAEDLTSAISYWVALVQMMGKAGPGICKWGIPQSMGYSK